MLCLLLGSAVAVVQLKPSAALTNLNDSPIQKVVTLVTEMKGQTIKEGEDDLAAYNKYNCWCVTTTAEKTAAIASATAQLAELESFVEEAAAKEGELKTEIAGLESDIAKDTEALKTATAMRNEENDEFETETADFKETIGLLTEAIAVLQKVQFIQKPEAHRVALLQVRSIIRRASPKFQGVMQKDLFDMLGEFKGVDQQRTASFNSKLATASFLGSVFMPKREAAVLAQNFGPINAGTGGLGVKSDEQLGKEAKPNGANGAAAGAKSYNSRSGGILGILGAQHDEFSKNLASAEKEEAAALAAFNKLAGAKNAEIASATEQKDSKSLELSDLMDKAAKAKEDIDATQNTLAADTAFLAETTAGCKSEDELFAARTKTRNEEIVALGETLDILTGDEARSLFDKTINFLQVSTSSAMMVRAQNKAVSRLLMMAKKSKNWQLASLAVRVKLDAFTKVKIVMDKMIAVLKEQQKVEYAKWESCKSDIDSTEDKIWTGKVEKRDLAAKHKDLTNTILVLTKNIEDLTTEVAEAEVSLKQAGEQRKAENQLFQSSVADQRAMITILNMALKRLKEFYEPKAALMQVHQHANPPPTSSHSVGYAKSGTSGGVMGLLGMIIADAGRTDAEMHADEQKSQQDYAGYVAATTAAIEADREAIAEKKKQVAGADAEKSETEESQLANQANLGNLAKLLNGLHNECDYIIKYFDIRQQSRAEEVDAIEEAKAILSGAK